MFALLQNQGASSTITHGRATLYKGTAIKTILHNWCSLRRANHPEIGSTLQQSNIKRVHCYICLFCDKDHSPGGRHQPHHSGISCFLKTVHLVPRTVQNHLLRQGKITSRGHRTNYITSTPCCSHHPRWKWSRTSYPEKDVTGKSLQHMDPTSEAYGKQLSNP
jgi:hypothetical protein